MNLRLKEFRNINLTDLNLSSMIFSHASNNNCIEMPLKNTLTVSKTNALANTFNL